MWLFSLMGSTSILTIILLVSANWHHLPFFLPTLTYIDLVESAKMWFQTLKMAIVSRRKGHLRSFSRTSCPLPLPMSLPSSVQITRIDWEKSANMWFFFHLKWSPFRGILDNWAQVLRSDCTPWPPKICVYKISLGSLQIKGARSQTKIRNNTFWILDPPTTAAAVLSNPLNTIYRSHMKCGT